MPVLANKTSNLYKSFLLVLMFGFSYVSAALGDNQASISYNSPADTSEQELAQVLKSSGVVEDVVAFINQKIRLSEPLYFMIGGDEGPLFDPSLNKIFIPYRFVQEVEGRFSAAKYSETGVSVVDATLDSVMHTLFHELAHALISNYQLPVVGKEEDAADSLASMLLIEYFDNGAEIAISAADLFDLESEEIDALEEGDFWDEHSLDAQRFYSTMCFVYGSNPEQYDSLIKELGLSQERAELCIEEYESIVRSWFTILKPYLK